MAFIEPLSIDISGEWSLRKALKVIEALRDEATARGLDLCYIDITTYADKFPKAIIVARCIYHECVIAPDSAYVKCIEEAGV